MARLNVLFSGQFDILLNGQAVIFGYNKVRALLAYLIIEGEQAHSRDELAGLLWPDQPEPIGRKNLRQALMNLRMALQENDSHLRYLLVNRETIQFNFDSDFYSDTLAISNLLKHTKEHQHKTIETCSPCCNRLIQAAEIYKGDFLSGFSVPDSLPFEEWLMFVRESSRLQAIEMMGVLVTANERNQDHEAAIQFSRRRLILDPWNEDSYRALMRTLWRMGQRTAALAEYERCKRILSDDLSINPSNETRDLADQIRCDTTSQAFTEKFVLPAIDPFIPVPLSALVGRETETEDLTALLKQNDIRLVTLMGPPGIGKTRLALHLADLLRDEFERNVYFIPLISITNPDILIDAIAHALGFSEGIQISPFNFLERTIKNQKILLVLDNFEQITSGATPLLKILQACPRIKLLVTSQSPLKIRGEQRFYLKPLQLPGPQQAENTAEILSSPAVKLFIETVRRNTPGIVIDSRNAHYVAELCARLDGLPLAIELAAASLKILSLRQLLRRIGEPATSALKNFTDRSRDTDTRHHSLWQAFQWSFNLLDPAAQILFSRLGIFNGSWSLEAAEAVCNIGDIQTGSMESMLVLLDDSLIQRVETQAGDYRFSMLDTLREFALDQLKSRGEVDFLHQRHADYFLTFAKLAEPEFNSLDQMEWLERIEEDFDNFRAALDWSLDNAPNEALQLCVALFPYWHIRSYLEEGRIYLERACAKSPLPTQLRNRGLAAAGLLAQRQGKYSELDPLRTQEIS